MAYGLGGLALFLVVVGGLGLLPDIVRYVRIRSM
jgi:hypothetical protein